MKNKLREIIKILERGTTLPCGECFMRDDSPDVCFDETSEHGRTCMLKARNKAIKKLTRLIMEAK